MKGSFSVVLTCVLARETPGGKNRSQNADWIFQIVEGGMRKIVVGGLAPPVLLLGRNEDGKTVSGKKVQTAKFKM